MIPRFYPSYAKVKGKKNWELSSMGRNSVVRGAVLGVTGEMMVTPFAGGRQAWGALDAVCRGAAASQRRVLGAPPPC